MLKYYYTIIIILVLQHSQFSHMYIGVCTWSKTSRPPHRRTAATRVPLPISHCTAFSSAEKVRAARIRAVMTRAEYSRLKQRSLRQATVRSASAVASRCDAFRTQTAPVSCRSVATALGLRTYVSTSSHGCFMYIARAALRHAPRIFFLAVATHSNALPPSFRLFLYGLLTSARASFCHVCTLNVESGSCCTEW